MVTILLADDNEDSREIYRTLFEVAGYRVTHAADGLQVLDQVAQHPPDVIMLNLRMEGGRVGGTPGRLGR